MLGSLSNDNVGITCTYPELIKLCILKKAYYLMKEEHRDEFLQSDLCKISGKFVTKNEMIAADLSSFPTSLQLFYCEREEIFNFISKLCEDQNQNKALLEVLKIFQVMLNQDGFTILNIALPALLHSFTDKAIEEANSNKRTKSVVEKELEEIKEWKVNGVYTHQNVRKAYYEASMQLHPDKVKGREEEFKKLKNLYDEWIVLNEKNALNDLKTRPSIELAKNYFLSCLIYARNSTGFKLNQNYAYILRKVENGIPVSKEEASEYYDYQRKWRAIEAFDQVVNNVAGENTNIEDLKKLVAHELRVRKVQEFLNSSLTLVKAFLPAAVSFLTTQHPVATLVLAAIPFVHSIPYSIWYIDEKHRSEEALKKESQAINLQTSWLSKFYSFNFGGRVTTGIYTMIWCLPAIACNLDYIAKILSPNYNTQITAFTVFIANLPTLMDAFFATGFAIWSKGYFLFNVPFNDGYIHIKQDLRNDYRSFTFLHFWQKPEDFFRPILKTVMFLGSAVAFTMSCLESQFVNQLRYFKSTDFSRYLAADPKWIIGNFIAYSCIYNIFNIIDCFSKDNENKSPDIKDSIKGTLNLYISISLPLLSISAGLKENVTQVLPSAIFLSSIVINLGAMCATYFLRKEHAKLDDIFENFICNTGIPSRA